MAAVRAAGQAVFDLVGRRRTGLQLAPDRAIRQREKADGRIACNVEQVVCHIASRYPSRRELPRGRKPARTRVERTGTVGKQNDLVERMVPVGGYTTTRNEGCGLILQKRGLTSAGGWTR